MKTPDSRIPALFHFRVLFASRRAQTFFHGETPCIAYIHIYMPDKTDSGMVTGRRSTPHMGLSGWASADGPQLMGLSGPQRIGFSGWASAWHLGILASWHPGILGSWHVWHPGILASWDLGILASWHPGILGSWNPCILGSWHPGILASWHPGILASWHPSPIAYSFPIHCLFHCLFHCLIKIVGVFHYLFAFFDFKETIFSFS